MLEKERVEEARLSLSIFCRKSSFCSPQNENKNKTDGRSSATRNSCVKMLIFRRNADESSNNNKNFAHHYGGSFSVFFPLLALYFRTHRDEAGAAAAEKKKTTHTKTWRFDDVIFYFDLVPMPLLAAAAATAVYIKRVYYFQVLYINSHYYHVNAIICRRVFVFNTQMNTQRYTIYTQTLTLNYDGNGERRTRL